jgi:hypothetical protein
MTLSTTATRAELLQRKSEINKQLVAYRGRISSLTDADGAEIERLAEEKDRIDAALAAERSTGTRPLGASREESASAGDLIRLSDGRRAAVARASRSVTIRWLRSMRRRTVRVNRLWWAITAASGRCCGP